MEALCLYRTFENYFYLREFFKSTIPVPSSCPLFLHEPVENTINALLSDPVGTVANSLIRRMN